MTPRSLFPRAPLPARSARDPRSTAVQSARQTVHVSRRSGRRTGLDGFGAGTTLTRITNQKRVAEPGVGAKMLCSLHGTPLTAPGTRRRVLPQARTARNANLIWRSKTAGAWSRGRVGHAATVFLISGTLVHDQFKIPPVPLRSRPVFHSRRRIAPWHRD